MAASTQVSQINLRPSNATNASNVYYLTQQSLEKQFITKLPGKTKFIKVNVAVCNNTKQKAKNKKVTLNT